MEVEVEVAIVVDELDVEEVDVEEAYVSYPEGL